MNITTPKMLAVAVRNERKKRNQSQKSVAEIIGLKQSTVSAFENYPDGTRMDTLFKLLAALDLELQIAPRNRKDSDKSEWNQEW